MFPMTVNKYNYLKISKNKTKKYFFPVNKYLGRD